MKKDWLGYVILPAAIVLALGGMSFAADGKIVGWLGIASGIALGLVAHRLMTPAKIVIDVPEAREVVTRRRTSPSATEARDGSEEVALDEVGAIGEIARR